MRICILAILLSTMCLAGCGHSSNSSAPPAPIPAGAYTAHYRSAATPMTIVALGGDQYMVTFQPTGANTEPITCQVTAGVISYTADGKHEFFLVLNPYGVIRFDVDYVTYWLSVGA